jgi:hypothetical protein
MRQLRINRLVATCALLAGKIVFACGPGAAQTAAASFPADTALAADTALFAAVVRSLPRAAYHDLAIDPRVVADLPSVVFIHPPGDFVLAAGPVVEARAAVIPRLRATRHTDDDYFACSRGPGGLTRADSAAMARAARLGPRRPMCVVAGIPRYGGAFFPPAGIDRRGSTPHGARTVRVVSIDPGQYTVYDVVAARRGGRWRVLEKVELFRGWS